MISKTLNADGDWNESLNERNLIVFAIETNIINELF